MIVLGLDTSTKTGMVVLECSDTTERPVVLHASVATSNNKGIERCSDLAAQVLELVYTYKPELVVIENYGFSNANTLAILVEIGTVIRYFLWQNDVAYVEVPPTSLKKFITGKGNTKKEDMKLHTYKKYGFEHESNDVVDAYGLAMMGAAIKGHLDMTTVQKQAIANLKTTGVNDG